MAETVAIPGSSGTAKIRQPWAVVVLAIITLFIYYLVWYYKTNRELRDYGEGDSPGLSLLAVSLGGFIIVPPFVSSWKYFGRIRDAQSSAGIDDRSDQWLGFVLYILRYIIVIPLDMAYAQQQLNKLWQRGDAATSGALGS